MRSATSTDVVFLAAKRTPFGTYGGSLKDLSATDLGVHAARAALAQAGISPERVDHVVFGNVAQTSSDAIYLARHVGLRAGAPVSTPALTVNRLCGSGFEAVVQGARLLAGGEAELVLVGGTESMSQAPLVLRGTRWGWPLGKAPPMEDMLWSALTDSYAELPMAMKAAEQGGRLAQELATVELSTRKGPVMFGRDEHPRPETTVEALRKLPKVFKKDGVVHAGAASGVSDGAGALLMATRGWAEKNGKQPLARLVNWGFAGVDPTIMGIGPVAAFQNTLARAQAKLSEFDLFEVNEAFAPQYLAVEKELGLPRDRTNVDGGAIAVGHPLAASGARITMHLIYELRRRRVRFGLGGACIGGGQGVAVALEVL